MDKLEKTYANRNLQEIYTLESSLIPLLVDMRWQGVRVDVKKAE